ncbi:hypothetical protein LPUS_12415 [Lasallia pustulata]|uniref:Uncharacterized protein n=1 Tax=Lasallia pustulata TaxID=136370 RepID=A0A1W5DER2_9LECA|nr:hypothetical protein LPUS_12415 [Lasallia pustulata]
MAEPSLPNNHHTSKLESEVQYDEARVIFNKTIDGHYRHSKAGYRKVGALFLTWKDDDMLCKETEVDKLRQSFEEDFKFKTECFEIPSSRWETALHKQLADFCYRYDSPEDLAIIYYGGHAYEGEETKEFKLAAAKLNYLRFSKFANDGHGDPTAFFNDIRTCLRLPACDQLVILDCCYAARAFARDHIGKRKFELLTSAAHDLICPAPKLPHSFTRTLNDTMIRLLNDNPNGFSTAHLYREVYHSAQTVKPLLFDQARHSFGKIWLRPQIGSALPESEKEGRFLKLTLKLNAQPDGAVMNELALQLQYLPHVDQVRFEDLYAPREQITDFMRFVVQAQKLRPLMRKFYAKRQLRRVLALKRGDNVAGAPPSLLKLHLEHNPQPAYDWSSAYAHFQLERPVSALSDTKEAEMLSESAGLSQAHGPDTRSVYKKNQTLDLNTEYPEPYAVGQQVYLKGARGVDPNPYTIHEVLGNGQYKLSRNGKYSHKVYQQADLRGEP